MTPQYVSSGAQQDNNWLTSNAAAKGKPAPVVHTSSLSENLFPAVNYIGGMLGAMDRMLDYALQTMWRPPVGGGPQHMMRLGFPAMTQQIFRPGVDITSDDKAYTISMEVPGVEEKDLQLEASDEGTLTIRGVKRDERTEDNKDVHYAECCYGAFLRTLSLPSDVDDKKIEARVKNGVLTIVCPRAENATAKTRPITINQGGAQAQKNGTRNERDEKREDNQNQREQAQREQNPRRAA